MQKYAEKASPRALYNFGEKQSINSLLKRDIFLFLFNCESEKNYIRRFRFSNRLMGLYEDNPQ